MNFLKELTAITTKLAEDDMPGGTGSLDQQTQGGMPQGSATAQQGPEGSEKETPPPNSEPSKEEPKVIAKAGDYKVQLGDNEQVSIVDSKGSIRLTMPLVNWKELTRQ